MKRNRRLLLSIVLAVFLCIVNLSDIAIYTVKAASMNTDVFSIESEKELNDNEQKLKEFAETFAKEFESGINLAAKEIIPMYDNENELIGCSISYYRGSIPYGYINLDLRSEDLITEFVIFEGADSLYDEMIEQAVQSDDSVKISDGTKRVYSVAPLDYYVSYKDKNKEEKYLERGISKENKKSLSKKEFQSVQKRGSEIEAETFAALTSTKYPSFDAIMKSEKDIGIRASSKMLKQYDKSKSLVSEAQSKTAAKRYACSVTALTAIAQQEGIAKSTLKDTYNSLWTYTGTTETAASKKNTLQDKITYGGTDTANLAIGMINYAKANGKKKSSYRELLRPTESFFKSAVDNNLPSTLSMWINTPDGQSGHTVSVVGYCTFLTSSGAGNASSYLAIANGWHNNAPRYISYNSIDFVGTHGVIYTFK